VVTRDEPADGPLGALLKVRGATVVPWPTVRVRPPRDVRPLRAALERLDRYDWIVFSSGHAVAAVTERHDPLPSLRVAAVGQATARSLERAGWPVHVVPGAYDADTLLAVWRRSHDLTGARVLFPASSIARATIPQALRRLGATVDQVKAYETVEASLDREHCLTASRGGELHAITFASPSAVTGLHTALGDAGTAEVIGRLKPVVIGDTTRRALAQWCGVDGTVAVESTLEGLADAVVTALQNGGI
jgi:uroporphyrinogen-III synthase